MALLITAPPGHEGERAYVADVVFGEMLGLPYECATHDAPFTTITMTDDPSFASLQLADVLLGKSTSWLQPSSLPSVPLGEWEGAPALYFDDAVPDVPLDVLGGVFFMLTRYEEVVASADVRDEFDRFPSTASVASKAGLLRRALVDEYVDLLFAAMQRVWPGLERRPRSYRLVLSHDVDDIGVARRTVGEVARSMGADVLVRAEPVVAARKLAALVSSRVARRPVAGDPYNTFDWVMSVSERACVTSTFNFFGGRSSEQHDARYSIEEPWLRGLVRSVHERGHQIGLHPSYETHTDADRLRRELGQLRAVCRQEGIEQDVWGARQHFLRWRAPDTWRAYDEAGIVFDSSVGHADQIGFRTGTCHEYPVWDVVAGRRLRVRERPLVAMEVSLLTYAKRSLEQAEADLLDVAAVCRRHRGDFTLLWHTHNLFSPKQRAAYQRIVRGAS